MTWPGKRWRPIPGTGCPVTVYRGRRGQHPTRCGDPVADGGDLCDHHAADRARLAGVST